MWHFPAASSEFHLAAALDTPPARGETRSHGVNLPVLTCRDCVTSEDCVTSHICFISTAAVSTHMTHTASGCGQDAVLTWLRDLSKSDTTSCCMITDWSFHMEPKLKYLSVFVMSRAGFEQDIDGDQSHLFDTCTGE